MPNQYNILAAIDSLEQIVIALESDKQVPNSFIRTHLIHILEDLKLELDNV